MIVASGNRETSTQHEDGDGLKGKPTIACPRPNLSAGRSLLLHLLLSLLWLQLALCPVAPARGRNSITVLAPQLPSTGPQNAPEVTTLELDKTVERELAGGQKHVYQISLSEGQHITVVIKQHGLNVGLAFRVPSGETIQVYEAFNSPQEMTIGEVAQASGIHQFDVYSRAKAPTGRYEIRLAALRQATENDLELQRARNLWLEYWRLHRQGKYLEARPLLIRSIEIREKVSGQEDLAVAGLLGLLGVNYANTGDYASAETLYLRQLKIVEKALGPDHPAVAQTLNVLGGLYLKKGDYLKAEEFDLKALGIFERAQQTETYEVVSLSSALGSIYYARGDYENAEKYYQRAHAVLEKMFGPDHFHLTGSFSFLGRVAYDAGDYAKAEAMFQRALTLSEKALGQDHPGVTVYRNDLATVYATTGDYAKAEALYRQALATHEEKAAMTSPVVQETLFGLARLYVARGMRPEAVQFQTRAGELEERYVGLNLAVGSEREKLAFLDKLSLRSSRNISLHTKLAPDNVAARDLAVTTILRRKGRVQDAMSASFSAMRLRMAAEDQTILDQLSEVTSRLAKLVVSGPLKVTPAQHQEQIKALEEERERLEAEVSRRSSGFYERSQPVALTAVQAAIPEEAALIEFAVYRPFDPKAPDNQSAYGKPHYVAYVVRRQGDVQWKELGEARKIDDTIDSFRRALRDSKREVRDFARAVDKEVMQPVRALVGGAKHLLISPDGELNLIPFEALVNEQGNYLVERYTFTYLTSGRDLLRMQRVSAGGNRPTVVANPSFGEPAVEQKASATRPVASRSRRRSVTSARNLSETYFASLSGTAAEARTIQKLFPESNLLTGAQATEAALKQAAGPRVLHIATHGFFLSEPGADRAPQTGSPAGVVVATGSPTQGSSRAAGASGNIDNPLLRSGLALAGANSRSGGNNDDGILTALEASGMNLWGTKLVVLSACDTGLGEVRNGEGVYGLRRAFVLAGAESLVMSLWPASDYTTRKLMTEYYKNLKQGMGRGTALRQVQLDMLRQNKQLHPFYWANFIQSGEWANLEGKR